jgi:hypothetical protein
VRTRVHLAHSGAYEPWGTLDEPVVAYSQAERERESSPHMIYLLRPKRFHNRVGEVINLRLIKIKMKIKIPAWNSQVMI